MGNCAQRPLRGADRRSELGVQLPKVRWLIRSEVIEWSADAACRIDRGAASCHATNHGIAARMEVERLRAGRWRGGATRPARRAARSTVFRTPQRSPDGPQCHQGMSASRWRRIRWRATPASPCQDRVEDPLVDVLHLVRRRVAGQRLVLAGGVAAEQLGDDRQEQREHRVARQLGQFGVEQRRPCAGRRRGPRWPAHRLAESRSADLAVALGVPGGHPGDDAEFDGVADDPQVVGRDALVLQEAAPWCRCWPAARVG